MAGPTFHVRTAGRSEVFNTLQNPLLSSSMPAPSKAIGIFCVIGLSLSCYAIYVENQIEESAALGGEYVALCDVSSWGMSCSKV